MSLLLALLYAFHVLCLSYKSNVELNLWRFILFLLARKVLRWGVVKQKIFGVTRSQYPWTFSHWHHMQRIFWDILDVINLCFFCIYCPVFVNQNVCLRWYTVDVKRLFVYKDTFRGEDGTMLLRYVTYRFNKQSWTTLFVN